MKTTKLSIFALLLALGGCSTSGLVYDDVYYSRKDAGQNQSNEVAAVSKSAAATTPSTNSEYEYQTYYETTPAQEQVAMNPEAVYSTTETVVEPDGTSYSTTETYYDSEYAQRIRRFNNGGSSFGYYDGYNTGCFDCYNGSFSMGFGYPYGLSFGFNYGWPYYSGYSPYWGYDPFWGSPWGWGWGGSYGFYSGYYNGYYNGFWDGYYYGNGWYGDYYPSYRPRTLYGHRGSNNSGSTIPGRGINRPSTENTTYSTPRGDRSTSSGNTTSGLTKDNITTSGSDRGATVNNRPGRETPAGDRVNRPQTQDKSAKPVQTRPSAQQKVNEYRDRYQRPSSNGTRESRYERPKSYTSPAVRQPKSSSEYVRPQSSGTSPAQRETRSTVNPNTQTARPLSTPQRTNSEGRVSQPSRSSSQGSNTSSRTVSQPSRSSSSGSSGNSSYSPSRSSSSGSGSSGTRSSGSSGSSSSGSSRGSSSGGRR